MSMKRYAHSNIYPIDKAAIEAIAENMRVNGYDQTQPIMLKDGAIVDGYHRHEAALRAGVQPKFRKRTRRLDRRRHPAVRVARQRRSQASNPGAARGRRNPRQAQTWRCCRVCRGIGRCVRRQGSNRQSVRYDGQ